VTHSEVLHNFVKPPIHGWALGQLRLLIADLTTADLARAYEQLERWTMFWLSQRRAPNRDLPYYQHGNDSGWDNATAFDEQRVIEAPDLAAFLVLQLRELAHLAARLGYDSAVRSWTARADELRTAMIDQLWMDDQFAVRGPTSWRRWSTSSLLLLMPIVLGEELPPEISDALAKRIEAHLTSNGLATELPTSEHYTPDGYWRGPIWAPSTVLIEDGLRRAGHIRLADEISLRFRALCEKSGFAENFDAQTGAGLRDRAYTWTASSYLRLAAADRRRRGHQPDR
jgi:glycogen debranching enzyme